MQNGYYETGTSRIDSEIFTGIALPNQQKDPDDGLIVTFSQEAVRNNFKSDQAGRDIADVQDWITIRAPGCRDDLYKGSMRPQDLKRPSFKRRYDAWKATAENKVSGTPLESWGYLNIAQIFELKALGISTVDELACVNESAFGRLGMGAMSLVKKAKDFIEAAKGQAPIIELRDKYEKLVLRNAGMEAQMIAMKAQLDLIHNNQAGIQSGASHMPPSALDFPTAPVREISFEAQPPPIPENPDLLAEGACVATLDNIPKKRGRPAKKRGRPAKKK